MPVNKASFFFLKSCMCLLSTDLNKDWIEQPIVYRRQNFKLGYVDRSHFGEMTLHTTALNGLYGLNILYLKHTLRILHGGEKI